METLATIAIYSLAAMLVIMVVLSIYVVGGFDNIFRSKKHKSRKVSEI